MIASRPQSGRRVRLQMDGEDSEKVVDASKSSGLVPSPPPRTRPYGSARPAGHTHGGTYIQAMAENVTFQKSTIPDHHAGDSRRPATAGTGRQSRAPQVSPSKPRSTSSRPGAARGRRTLYKSAPELQFGGTAHNLPAASPPERMYGSLDMMPRRSGGSFTASLTGFEVDEVQVLRDSVGMNAWSGSFSRPAGMPGPEVVGEVISGASTSGRPYRTRARAVTSSGGSTFSHHARQHRKVIRPSLQEFTNLNQGFQRPPSPSARSCASARRLVAQTPGASVEPPGPSANAVKSEVTRSTARAVSAPGIRTTPSRPPPMRNPSFNPKAATTGGPRSAHESLRLSSARAARVGSYDGGWAANRPKTAATAPRCSDRAVVQPVLTALDNQVKLSKTMERRAMIALNPVQQKVKFSNKRVQQLWRAAKVKSMKVVRDAKQKAEELMMWENTLASARHQVVHSKSGSYVRIARGTINVPVKVIKELKAEFESMDTNGIGVVPYTKLLGRINTAGGRGSLPIQVKSGLMTRMVDRVDRVESAMGKSSDTLKAASGGQQSFKQRLSSHVFNFEDMLKMQYPDAEPGDLKRILGLAFPDKESLQHLKLKQVTAAVEMFNKMDPLDSGVCDLDALEDVLIDEFPNDNVYLIIKTMPKDMTGKLYNDDHITMKEFINWYARLTNEKIFLINSGQQADLMSEKSPQHLEPATVLSGYIKGHESRVHFRKASLNAYLSNHGKALK